ncbi:hypothetical protein KM043_005257 [Ampulex compressa]|nr:hypothetical protein KM043_005257 [Ampulex compressa]
MPACAYVPGAGATYGQAVTEWSGYTAGRLCVYTSRIAWDVTPCSAQCHAGFGRNVFARPGAHRLYGHASPQSLNTRPARRFARIIGAEG